MAVSHSTSRRSRNTPPTTKSAPECSRSVLLSHPMTSPEERA